MGEVTRGEEREGRGRTLQYRYFINQSRVLKAGGGGGGGDLGKL